MFQWLLALYKSENFAMDIYFFNFGFVIFILCRFCTMCSSRSQFNWSRGGSEFWEWVTVTHGYWTHDSSDVPFLLKASFLPCVLNKVRDYPRYKRQLKVINENMFFFCRFPTLDFQPDLYYACKNFNNCLKIENFFQLRYWIEYIEYSPSETSIFRGFHIFVAGFLLKLIKKCLEYVIII